MTRKNKILLTIVCSLLVGAVCSVSTDFRILLRKNDRSSYVKENEVETTLINGDGSLTVILSDEGGADEGRFVNRLRLTLLPREEKPLKLRAVVHLSTGESFTLSDFNPLYVKQQVFRIRRDRVKSVDIIPEEGRFTTGDVQVDNAFHWNVYLFLAGVFLSLPLFVIGFFRGTGDDAGFLRKAFLLLSLTAGLTIIAVLPSGKVGNDEETHLQAVLQIASFPSNELHVSQGVMNQVTVTEYNHPDALPKGSLEKAEYEKRLSQDADYKDGVLSPGFYVLPERVLSYLPMAAAVKIAKGFSLPWSFLLRAARLANLLLYAALIYAALRVLPEGHLLMALIALFPENLFLASTVSYDPYVTGFLFLGSAFLVRLLRVPYADERKFLRDYLLMTLSFFIGCLPKAVYAPLVLSAIPVLFRQFPDRKKRAVFIGISLAAFLLAVLLFIAPTLIAPPDTGDTRGSAEVSEASQIGFILGNPLLYAGILLRQMVTWIPQCMLGPDCSTFMGHLVNGSTEFQGLYVPYLLLLLFLTLPGFIDSVRKGKENGECLRTIDRIYLLFLCFGVSVLIWTSMYVAYTKPGALWIDGVQGRYFIPLLFLIYFSIAGKGKGAFRHGSLVRTGRIWYDSYLAVIAILTGASVLFSVVIPYCL